MSRIQRIAIREIFLMTKQQMIEDSMNTIASAGTFIMKRIVCIPPTQYERESKEIERELLIFKAISFLVTHSIYRGLLCDARQGQHRPRLARLLYNIIMTRISEHRNHLKAPL